MFSPRLGLNLWDGGKNTYHVFYGRFYAAPLLEDVRQDCVLLQGCTGVPVYNLQPERDSYYEMGWQYAFNPAFTGSINVFRRTAVNVLDTTQLLNTPLFAVFNNAIGIDNGRRAPLTGSAAERQRVVSEHDVLGLRTRPASRAPRSSFLPTPTNPACRASPSSHPRITTRPWSRPPRTPGGSEPTAAGLRRCKATTAAAFRSRSKAPTPISAAGFRRTRRSTSPPDGISRRVAAGQDRGLGISLIVDNVLNHQYAIKVANGFNTTQIANGTTYLLRLSAPF